jgi:beta-glucosidase
MSTLNTAVSRILRAKFQISLFKHPDIAVLTNETMNYFYTKKHVDLLRQTDTKSTVLLENYGNTFQKVGERNSNWANGS